MQEPYLIFCCSNCLLECAVEKSLQGQNIICPSCENEFLADKPIGEIEPPEIESSESSDIESSGISDSELDALALEAMDQAQKENDRLNVPSRIKGSNFKKEWDKLLARDLSDQEIHALLTAHGGWIQMLFTEMLNGGFEQLKKENPQLVECMTIPIILDLKPVGLEDKVMLVKENLLRLHDDYLELGTGQKVEELPEQVSFGQSKDGKPMKMVIKKGGQVEIREVTQEELDKRHRDQELSNAIGQKMNEMTQGGKMVMIKDMIRERLRIEAQFAAEEEKRNNLPS